MEALKKSFAPEFLNRLDSIVTFKDLDEGMILRVVHKFIEELRMQLVKKNVEMQVSAEAAKWLMVKGYDKVYGARPMARAIDEHIKRAMVDQLLFGDLSKGGRMFVDVKDNQLTIETESAEAVTS